ncbi:type VI secretion system baseplate subunit TssF [Methylobrevis albus]|uniref:Type VI secretion system baseplate subunit TssF n=1 Tax=Methylobrevis albus TaxID=2793297 RepID=A0A931HZA6_9HYPH|nr:type VI secretion system baseplate subunit TssF [Methylobrevis albus]MBH0236444.1 type VI secretion system baseplate subunit TssF [Methylobrevis albus]
MNREFLDLYNRELALLNEQAREFAEEYPGVAERLGGLMADRMDPMIGGLLEGAAFLAARVQLKLKHEFSEFTHSLIEQLVPQYLAPTPSVLLARVTPPFGDPALRDGMTLKRGAYLDATYRERDRRVACRFRLSSDIELWPFEIMAAEYLAAPGPLQALGLPVGPQAAAGLRLTLTHRTQERPEDEPAEAAARDKPEMHFAGCRTRKLRVHLTGAEADAVALYEQLFAHCQSIWFRHLDGFGDPVAVRVPEAALRQVGFAEEESLLPNDMRLFRGFDLLREYFMFPRKFLGFDLIGLETVMPKLASKQVELIFVFDEVNPRLSAAVRRESFALGAAPAVNLFEKTLDRIPVRANQHEYHVVPDRSRMLDFEPNRVLDVYAHIAGQATKVPVPPLYSAPRGLKGMQSAYAYTVRRLPRRRSAEERKYGVASDYVGTDMFLSLGEPDGIDDDGVAELSVRALCTNRHLTEHLPVGDGGADFRFLDDVSLVVSCIAGPTRPREPVATALAGKTDRATSGEVAWRLINMLSLNHLGLVERAGGRSGQSLREVLGLFADVADSATERRIRGVRSVDSRPIVRRLRQRAGTGAARGIEVTVLLDEKAFEGTGTFLLGAVLERFFAEYVGVNHFTQTVIRTTERGETMRWPARTGSRGEL